MVPYPLNDTSKNNYILVYYNIINKKTNKYLYNFASLFLQIENDDQYYFKNYMNISKIYLHPYLIKIIFTDDFNQSIENIKWPQTVEYIDFNISFKQPINNINWPKSLIEIKLHNFIDISSLLEFKNNINIIIFNLPYNNFRCGKYQSYLNIYFEDQNINEEDLINVPINVDELNIYYVNKLPRFKLPYGCSIKTFQIF